MRCHACSFKKMMNHIQEGCIGSTTNDEGHRVKLVFIFDTKCVLNLNYKNRITIKVAKIIATVSTKHSIVYS